MSNNTKFTADAETDTRDTITPATPENRIHEIAVRDALTELQRAHPEWVGDVRTIPVRILEEEIMRMTKLEICMRNTDKGVERSEKMAVPKRLTPAMIGQVLLARGEYRRLILTGRESSHEVGQLARYVEDQDDPHYGTYRVDVAALKHEAAQFNCTKPSEFAEVEAYMQGGLEAVRLTRDPCRVAVQNGIVNTTTMELEDFNPDYVTTGKFPVNFVRDAPSPLLRCENGDSWDVETWLSELTGDDHGSDPEVKQQLWEIIAAVLQPDREWEKMVWLIGVGSNGKSAYQDLLVNVIGDDLCAVMTLCDFADRHRVSNTVGKVLVYGDENDAGDYMKASALLKSYTVHEEINVEPKYVNAYSYQPRGMIVQNFNEMPRFRDKSWGMERRILPIPFKKRFEGGMKKPEIRKATPKTQVPFLARPEVLEYVLWTALSMQVTQLSMSMASDELLGDYREANDPVQEYWLEFKDQFVWDLLPNGFLYDLFRAWSQRDRPTSNPHSKHNFLECLRAIVDRDPAWEDRTKRGAAVRPADKMTAMEPLISEYDLERWGDRHYKGNDFNRRNIQVHFRTSYDGLLRAVPSTTPGLGD